MSNTKTVLILGATGSIGAFAARAFVAAGWRVLALVRPGKSPHLPQGVTAIAANLFDTADAVQAVGPVDVVFNGLNAPYPDWPKALLPLFTAAADLSEALNARQIYPGSVYNFGSAMPTDLTPATPFAATTVKGRLRVAIELMFQQRAAQGRLKTIVLRAGDFIGDGAKNSWMSALVAKDVKKGIITTPGKADTVHAWAYLPDVAEILVRLADAEQGLKPYEVFHFDNHNVSAQDLAAAASAVLRRKVRVTHMPKIVFSIFGMFDPFMKATIEMLYLWDVPHALKDDRLERVVGPLPRTPLADIMAELAK